MQILNTVKNKDGSELWDVEFTDEEVQFLIQYAVTNILREEIERIKNENNLRTTVSNEDALSGVVVE